jgi:hypothetical protein
MGQHLKITVCNEKTKKEKEEEKEKPNNLHRFKHRENQKIQ